MKGVKVLSMVLLGALAILAMAVPAAAQQDPYGEVLPRDIIRPPDGGDVTVPPDGETNTAPGMVGVGDVSDGAVGSGDVAGRDAARADRGQARPAPVVPAERGQLARTGFGLTVGALLLGVALLLAGTSAVMFARRRPRSDL